MTVKFKCGKKTVSAKAEEKITKGSHYDEHAAMHYEGGGWYHWTEVSYIIEKCPVCGKRHEIKKDDLL